MTKKELEIEYYKNKKKIYEIYKLACNEYIVWTDRDYLIDIIRDIREILKDK